MRKLTSIAGAALLAFTALATPASAQGNMMAGGSCGSTVGAYGLTDINSDAFGTASHGVPSLFYTVNYANVPAPTTIGVIIRYNGELESQTAVASFTADKTGGSFDGAIRVSTDPKDQGFANSQMATFAGRGDNGTVSMKGKSSERTAGVTQLRGDLQNSPTQAGIVPGEYVFYVYTGSRGDVYNVKDGTVARNAFIADEKGFLGRFSCGVSTDQGSGPG
jgi:hypothetical protein